MTAITPDVVESLGEFGAVDDDELATLDRPPIPFTLIGYQIAPEPDGTHPEHRFEFHVRPAMAFGPWFKTILQSDARGQISDVAAIKLIGSAITPEDRDRFMETLDRPDLEFFASAIGEIAKAIVGRYTKGLPTMPRSARRWARAASAACAMSASRP